MAHDPYCSDCHGTGFFKCLWCRGKGCNQCNDSGVLECTCEEDK